MDNVKNARLIYEGDDEAMALRWADEHRPTLLRRRGLYHLEVWALGTDDNEGDDPFPPDPPFTVALCGVAAVAGAWGVVSGEWGATVLAAAVVALVLWAEFKR